MPLKRHSKRGGRMPCDPTMFDNLFEQSGNIEDMSVSKEVLANQIDVMQERQGAHAVFVKNPQIDIASDYQVPILYGPKTTRKQVTTCSNASTSLISYTEKIPVNNLVDRRMYIENDFYLTITGAAYATGGGNLFQAGLAAPRSFPTHQCCTNLELKLNGESVSTVVSDYISALSRYFSEQDYRESFTGCPAMLDQATAYSQTYNTARNPLGLLTGNSYQPPRGIGSNVLNATTDPVPFQVYFSVYNNTTTSYNVHIKTIEPIMISPLRWGATAKECPAFANLLTMDVNYSLGSPSRLWSQDLVSSGGSTPGSFAVNWNSGVANPVVSQLHYTIITPPDDRPVNPLGTYFYDYFNIQRFPTNVSQAVSAGASSSVATQIVNPTNVPSRLFIYLRASNTTLTAGSTDTFAKIDSVQVQWNNNTFLASADSWDLYQMSQANGLSDNYANWNYYTGSVLALELAKDIGLDPLQAPGMVLNNQLMITINFTNTSTSSVTYTAFIVTICPGTFEIGNQRGRANLGVISASDLILARSSPFLSYEEVVGLQPYGGSFWSSLAKPFKSAYRNVVKPAAKFAARNVLLPAATIAAEGYGGPLGAFAAEQLGDALLQKLGAGMRQGGLGTGGMNLGGINLGGGRRRKARGGYVNESANDLLKRLMM